MPAAAVARATASLEVAGSGSAFADTLTAVVASLASEDVAYKDHVLCAHSWIVANEALSGIAEAPKT